MPSNFEKNQNIHVLITGASSGIGFSASQFIKYGQYKEAIGLTKLAISLTPNKAELWMMLATAELNNKQLNDSLKSINKAIGFNPNLSNVWFTKASIEIQIGDIESCIQSINKSITIINDKRTSTIRSFE